VQDELAQISRRCRRDGNRRVLRSIAAGGGGGRSVRDAVLLGAVLAVVVLLLFLVICGATLVTAAIIPATVLITFMLMRLSGLTLNLMTLGRWRWASACYR